MVQTAANPPGRTAEGMFTDTGMQKDQPLFNPLHPDILRARKLATRDRRFEHWLPLV